MSASRNERSPLCHGDEVTLVSEGEERGGDNGGTAMMWVWTVEGSAKGYDRE